MRPPPLPLEQRPLQPIEVLLLELGKGWRGRFQGTAVQMQVKQGMVVTTIYLRDWPQFFEWSKSTGSYSLTPTANKRIERLRNPRS